MPQTHLLRNNPSQHVASQNQVSDTGQASDSRIFGMQKEELIHIGIIALIVIIVIAIIVTIYRRYQTKKDYNQSPQNFPHKPDLGVKQNYYLKNNKIEACLNGSNVKIEQLQEINGKIWKVQFKGKQKSAVFFHRRQYTTSYFQVQIISESGNGSIEVGFVPISSFEKIKDKEEGIGSSGIGVTDSGYIQAQGENLYNYGWSLVYGDIFGVGLTRQNSKFSERRAWISKNGVLLNNPPSNQLGRWLATINISAEQKNEFNLNTQGDESELSSVDKQNLSKIRQKAQKQKVQGLLKKQIISLKTFDKFEYYPVVYYHGSRNSKTPTIININVGGQIFRMNDKQFRSGLLKDKTLFGDDQVHDGFILLHLTIAQWHKYNVQYC